MRERRAGEERGGGTGPVDVAAGSGPVRVVLAGADTGGRFALLETRERPGDEPPLHAHTREDELVYVLAGRLTLRVGDAERDCPAGTGVLLARGCEHTYRVESGEARLLVLLVPAGLEGLYRELGAPADGRRGHRAVDGGQAFERLVTVAARYGVAITGPPPGD